MSEQKIIEIDEPHPVTRKAKQKLRGSAHMDFQERIERQVFYSLSLGGDSEQISKDYVAAMCAVDAFDPQDEVEAMMAVQLVALHNTSIDCISRAMVDGQSFEARNMNLNQANKLSRSFATMLEAMNKHRGKGQQKITVEHVTVEQGGQAVIGNVNTDGRGE